MPPCLLTQEELWLEGPPTSPEAPCASGLRSPSLRCLGLACIAVRELALPFQLAQSGALPGLRRLCVGHYDLHGLKTQEAAEAAAADLRACAGRIAATEVEVGGSSHVRRPLLISCVPLDCESSDEEGVACGLLITALAPAAGTRLVSGTHELQIFDCIFAPGDMARLCGIFACAPALHAIYLGPSVHLSPASLAEAVQALPGLRELSVSVHEGVAAGSVLAACAAAQRDAARQAPLRLELIAWGEEAAAERMRGAVAEWEALGPPCMVQLCVSR